MDKRFKWQKKDVVSFKERDRRIQQNLKTYARFSSEEVLESLETTVKGLSTQEAEKKLEIYQKNEFSSHKNNSVRLHLWRCYANPFSLLLTALATFSWITSDATGASIILTMILLATLMRFFQERRSQKSAESIQSLVKNTISVLRQEDLNHGEVSQKFSTPQTKISSFGKEIPISDLVPGDIIYLSAGDMVPADVRLLSSKDLFVSQSALTGESMPIEKFANPLESLTGQEDLFDLPNITLMGVTVVSGSATAVVVTTGSSTLFGALAGRLMQQKTEPTAFQKGIRNISFLVVYFMLAMVPVVLLLNGFTKGDWLEASIFAFTIAMGLTPELLPLLITANLEKGAVFLSRKKVIVKNLDAIQSFGAMDILCTDKTGTLTQDKIVLEQYTDTLGQEDSSVLSYAYLNSYYQTGLRNLLDSAILAHKEVDTILHVKQEYEKCDEIPFDFVRRRMSVVVTKKTQHNLLICKGAVEEVLNACTQIHREGKVLPLEDSSLEKVREVVNSMSISGLRVIAVALREFPLTQTVYSQADESNMNLMGLVAFLDPPKESTEPALKALAKSGVSVKILTGDNEFVTQKVCHDVDLPVTGVVLGKEIDLMSQEEFKQKVRTCNIFAKLTPSHKESIIQALKSQGHVVGYMGDGINDTLALKTADVSISVDSGVDIAKESADLILLEKSLMVLEDGVIEGRRTFGNVMKYLNMATSSNFGNAFSVLIASYFLPFLPMLPVHLLIQNLLYEISQIGMAFDNVDKEYLEKPQRWEAKNIGRFMLFFGPISSIFDMITFIVLWFVFKANSPENQVFFQSGWFVFSTVSQTLIVHALRTRHIPFIKSLAAPPLLIMSGIIAIIAIVLPQNALASVFGLAALPMSYYLSMLVIVILYMIVVQLVKGVYTRSFGWQ